MADIVRQLPESLSCLVALAIVAGCTAAPDPAKTAPRSGAGEAPVVRAAPRPSAATAAVATASAPVPAVVVPPPVFPEPMVTIGRGTFTMGCPKTAASVCRDDEKPRHRVVLSPYEIDVYEVTAGHYQACVNAGACNLRLDELEGLDPRRAKATTVCREQFRAEQSKRPVVCVGMTEAQEYCEWRGKRLPTEAEWERAARGDTTSKDGETRLYPWGDEPPNTERACVQAGARCEVGGHPSGVSPFGLHDMAGNAAEWVWDYFDAKFYASSPVRDPDGSWELLPIHKQSCPSSTCWTVRGGSWQDNPVALRSTARVPEAPDYPWAFTTIGFRCARSTEASRRKHFADRVNIWNAKRIESSNKSVSPH